MTREIFEYLKDRINQDIPNIRTVRIWNDQFVQSNEQRKEKAFPYPCLFVEFISNDVRNWSLGIKDIDLTIRFRYGLESYKFERLDDLDLSESLDSILQELHRSGLSGVVFSTIQLSNWEHDSDHENVNVPILDYSCYLRKSNSFRRRANPIASITSSTITIDKK